MSEIRFLDWEKNWMFNWEVLAVWEPQSGLDSNPEQLPKFWLTAKLHIREGDPSGPNKKKKQRPEGYPLLRDGTTQDQIYEFDAFLNHRHSSIQAAQLAESWNQMSLKGKRIEPQTSRSKETPQRVSHIHAPILSDHQFYRHREDFYRPS